MRAPNVCSESICLRRETEPSIRTSTFKKITFVSSPSPDVDESIYVLCWDSMPASEDEDGVPITSPVVSIFIKPVPAVAEEICAKSHRRFSVVVSLFANPIKCSIKRAFTGTLKKKKKVQPLVTWCKNQWFLLSYVTCTETTAKLEISMKTSYSKTPYEIGSRLSRGSRRDPGGLQPSWVCELFWRHY